MITHRIIKKSVIRLPIKTEPTFPVPVPVTVPTVFRGRGPALVSVTPTQEELDQYLLSCVLKEGMFVASQWRDLPNISASVDPKVGWNYILFVQRDHKKLPYVFDKGHPRCFYLVSLFGSTPTPHVRWDSELTYRPMLDTEYKTLIEPEYDHIQNNLQQWREAFKSALA